MITPGVSQKLLDGIYAGLLCGQMPCFPGEIMPLGSKAACIEMSTTTLNFRQVFGHTLIVSTNLL